MSKRRKRFAIIGALVALALLAGGIAAAVVPSSKKPAPSSGNSALSATKGNFPDQVRRSFLAGCKAGKTGSQPLCRCLLLKTEANYSAAEIQKLEADEKRGARPPSRVRKLFLDCYAPKGIWSPQAHNHFIAGCSNGRADRASACRCLVAKVEAAYSGAEVQAAEASHDPRYRSLKTKWIAECFQPH